MGIKFDVDAAFGKLADLAAEHGPAALSAAENVKRINGLEDLSGAAVWGGVAIVMILMSKYLFNKAKSIPDGFDSDLNKVGLNVSGGISSIIALWIGAVSVQVLLNPWVWTAIFNPKLALARDIWVKLTY